MCGRFTLRIPLTVLIEHFELDARGDRQLPLFEARYNIAPTQEVLVIRADPTNGQRTADMLRWGLIPSWTTADKLGSGPPLINARAETLAEKPSFRTALRKRRCLIPADGFYEWQQSAGAARGKKQPYYIHQPDGGPFAFAGLWERWVSKGGRRNSTDEGVLQRQNDDEPSPGASLQGTGKERSGPLVIESCTIVTTSANRMMSEMHERMPVILAPNDYATWLDASVEDSQSLMPLLSACGEDELTAEPIGTYVNRVANDGPECIAVQRSLFY